MHCDREKLSEYRGGGLSQADRAAVEEHLRRCAECRVTVTLDRLDPTPSEAADAGAAFARFSDEVARNRPRATGRVSWLDRIGRERIGFDRTGPDRIPVWRPAAVVLAAAAALVLVISYAPARQVLADFLAIFRVREFSAITIDRAQLDKLGTLKESLRTSGLVTPTTEREPAQPRAVASASEAGSLAGFDVQSPSHLPAGAQSKSIEVVAPGPAVRVEFDPAKIESQLAAAGITGVRLPPMRAGMVRAEVSSIVTQEFTLPWSGAPERAPSLRIVQATSPAVTRPPGADPKALGETYLKILGVPEEDASRLAARIDWTGTLLIPMPVGLGTFREIEVGGEPGLYMEQTGPEDAQRRASVVLWQHGGVIRAVIGDRVAPSEMLQIAESMHS
jgi:hypothetical protein